MSLEIPYSIKPVVALSHLDQRYGPWADKAAALKASEGLRKIGLIQAVIENNLPVEYYFATGIADADFVKKPGGTDGGASLAGLSNDWYTPPVSENTTLILDGSNGKPDLRNMTIFFLIRASVDLKQVTNNPAPDEFTFNINTGALGFIASFDGTERLHIVHANLAPSIDDLPNNITIDDIPQGANYKLLTANEYALFQSLINSSNSNTV